MSVIARKSGAYYRLVSYDVWGNARDGWEVNNRFVYDDTFFVSDDATAKEIVHAIKIAGFLATDDLRKLEVDLYTYDNLICINCKNGKPLFGLERMESNA